MLLPNLAGLTLSAVVAFATDPVSYEYSPQADANGKAFLTVTFNEPADGVQIVIRGDDGTTIKKSPGSMKGGKDYQITWTQKNQQVRYEMELTGDSLSGNFTFEIIKQAAKGKVGKLKFMSSREDIVDRQQAKYETSFALTSYEYKIIDDDGDVIANDTVTKEVSAGSTFTIKWNSPANVFMVEVRGEDQYGRFVEDRRVPYSADIPHTEVNFDSGKSDIKPGEVPKLDEAVAVAFHELDALDRVNEAVQANLTPQLYIVGYTDTVGDAGSNQKLSNGRAKAIAKYFYDQGFWAEIYYAGMGERGLRVETGDNVDEVRNRRALYLIAFQKPGSGGQIPGSWTKLAGHRGRPAGFELPALPPQWADYRNKKKKGGGGSGNVTDGGSGDGGGLGGSDGGDDDWAGGGGNDDGGSPSGDGGGRQGGGDDGPPPVEGEPGATGKGCTMGEGATPLALGWLVLLGAVARRRRWA
ncbi:OmpA family protein [Paraliomyxa miuraensis]|uniref:OmpA family protein n=1 Tax=Paraliomyxa miuraensis TaxID=376150 RepID=UPI002250D7F5|nr:OmpA family protein [Paraliomyxa miuraensis]MCX4243308.1 OmpA family protein [Paraliomyxa miuraensis]